MSFVGPDYLLSWPSDLLVSEIGVLLQRDIDEDWFENGRRLLSEAFEGSVPTNRFQQEWGNGPDDQSERIAYLRHLVAIADTFPPPGTRKPLWKDRVAQAHGTPPDSEQAQRKFAGLVAELDALGYFEKLAGEKRQVLTDYIGIPNLWPLSRSYPWTEDDFLSLIELLDDFVARPRNREYHEFGGYAMTLNQTGSSWSASGLEPVNNSAALDGVSCPSSTVCKAVGGAGGVATYDPQSPSSYHRVQVDASYTIESVTCPSASMCLAVDNDGRALSYNGTSWPSSSPDGTAVLSGVSCASTLMCEAVDQSGNVLAYNGSSWSNVENVDGTKALDGVSCPTVTLCVAVDNGGDAIDYAVTVTAQMTWDTTSSLPQILSDGSFDYIDGPNGTPVEQVQLSTSTPTFMAYTPDDNSWLTTNSSGQETGFWNYDAYGTLASGNPTSAFGYAGQYSDANSGLSDLRARWYEPSTGEFTTVDPALIETDQPYSYADDDPVNNWDPTGDDTYGTSSTGAIDAQAYAVQQEDDAINAAVGTNIDDNTEALQWCGATANSLYPGKTAGYGRGQLNATSSPSQWAEAVLRNMGWPVTQDNVFAFDAWEEGEHSTDWGPADPDAYNPLDTTKIHNSHPVGQDLCPDAPITTPGCGVQAYNTAKDGLSATVVTLREAQYRCFLNAVFSGADENPGDTLANLLTEAPFAGSWPGDAAYVQSEYNVEVQSGQPWAG